ncbi:MAG: hypothetical protein HKN82_03250, partial [Akkermansiaceae bacterium]|nr:hypothetical protein [Akkermansiaceae bacterium]
TVLTGPEPSGDDYTVWAEMFPGADLSDPNGDFDGDGLTNNEERLFGTDPTDPSSLNQYPTGLFDSTEFTFSFSRRDDALTGLFSDIETSFDLQMWTEDIGAMLVEGAVDGSTMVEIVEVTLSPGLLTAPKLFVRVNQNEGVFISENFEVDNGGFTVVTTAGTDWEHGAPDSSGLGGAVSGGNGGSTNAWGTNLGDFSGTTGNNGYYADSTITSLRSTVIDLTGVSAAELLFAEALDLEAGDTAVVNIIDDTTDTVISSAIYTASDGDDASADWNNVGPIAIPAGALGQAVRIEWLFTGFGGATDDYLGWYIDDVTVRRAAP